MMTVALNNEVVTAAPARTLRLVSDVDTAQAPVAKTVALQPDNQPSYVVGDPLVEGATRLLSIPLRHLYAALWRVGLLDVRA
jgi:hypothetical protein